MAKYKFIKLPDESNQFEVSQIEMTVDTVSWTDLVQEFELFLKGCGFVFDGTLDVVEEDNDINLDPSEVEILKDKLELLRRYHGGDGTVSRDDVIKVLSKE